MEGSQRDLGHDERLGTECGGRLLFRELHGEQQVTCNCVGLGGLSTDPAFPLES